MTALSIVYEVQPQPEGSPRRSSSDGDSPVTITWRSHSVTTSSAALAVLKIAEPMRKNAYGEHLLRLVESGE